MKGLEEVLEQLYQERNGKELSQYQDKVRSRKMVGNTTGKGQGGLNVMRREVERVCMGNECRYKNYGFRMKCPYVW